MEFEGYRTGTSNCVHELCDGMRDWVQLYIVLQLLENLLHVITLK